MGLQLKTEDHIKLVNFLADGKSIREISEIMQYSDSAVRYRVKKLFAYLAAEDKEQAISNAKFIGWVKDAEKT